MYFSDKNALFYEVLQDYHAKIKSAMEGIAIDEYITTGDGKGFLQYIIEMNDLTHRLDRCVNEPSTIAHTIKRYTDIDKKPTNQRKGAGYDRICQNRPDSSWQEGRC